MALRGDGLRASATVGDPLAGDDEVLRQLATSTGISVDDLRYLVSQSIVQRRDGTGRWVRVIDRADGSTLMRPVDPAAILKQRDIEEGAENLHDSTGMASMMMDELQVRTNARARTVLFSMTTGEQSELPPRGVTRSSLDIIFRSGWLGPWLLGAWR